MTPPSLQNHRSARVQARWHVYPATLIGFGLMVSVAFVMVAWLGGHGPTQQIAQQIQWFQQHPPTWVQAPALSLEHLLIPTIALLGTVLITMKLSPQPNTWSRGIVVGTLAILTLRYLLWRSLSTLNFGTPLSGLLSVGLLGLELLTLSASTIQLFLLFKVRDRRREADVLSVDVQSGDYRPSVDVLIPTYDEPEAILRRTVIGCQAMDYANHRVYLLDDTCRPGVQHLAQELGCEYITRPDNRHAKAGNLNHAIAQTTGDLIVVFDADFVPTTNFLTRTLGFFQKPNVALVQTPQSFYNPDPLARNLRLESVLTPEEEVFYRQIQPMRDGTRSVTCCGSSFVVRRSALEPLGGFDTESIAEDYFTGVRLSALDYDLVYLNEKLSAGLAPENMADYATQRIRWARGTLQALFIQANPLTLPGLTWVQRLVHLEGLLHWFTNLSRIGFLLMPLVYAFMGIIPIWATPSELVYFFLPYYAVQMVTFAWLNDRSRSALLSDLYSIVLCFPIALAVLQTLIRPFSRGFKVTPKGTESDRFRFNWVLASPLILLFIATAASLWVNVGMYLMQRFWVHHMMADGANAMKSYGLGWIWSAYNLVMVGLALLILLDVPRPDSHPWFPLQRTVRLTMHLPSSVSQLPQLALHHVTDDQSRLPGWSPVRAEESSSVSPAHLPKPTFWGTTTLLSQVGMEVALPKLDQQPHIPGGDLAVTLEMVEEQLAIAGQITHMGDRHGIPVVQIRFDELTLAQQRQMIQLLFCRPGQWQRHQTPGELETLWLLTRTLLRPHALLAAGEPRTIAVSSVRRRKGGRPADEWRLS
nr:cellulose synthase catalytic subunit [Leptolyngbya sp. CCY15150]